MEPTVSVNAFSKLVLSYAVSSSKVCSNSFFRHGLKYREPFRPKKREKQNSFFLRKPPTVVDLFVLWMVETQSCRYRQTLALNTKKLGIPSPPVLYYGQHDTSNMWHSSSYCMLQHVWRYFGHFAWTSLYRIYRSIANRICTEPHRIVYIIFPPCWTLRYGSVGYLPWKYPRVYFGAYPTEHTLASFVTFF